MKLETERLIIRPVTPEDTADYFEIFGNPHIARYDDFPLTMNVEDAKNDIIRILSNYQSQTGDQEYAVQLRESGKVIGVLAYRIKESFAYIGYHFNESYHGHGFATEAMFAFLPWLIENEPYGIHAAVDPKNQPSIKVLDKLGFRYIETRSILGEYGDTENEWIYSYEK
jgi:[ribosomal protein S5]-alanine N-acetyltransferase